MSSFILTLLTGIILLMAPTRGVQAATCTSDNPYASQQSFFDTSGPCPIGATPTTGGETFNAFVSNIILPLGNAMIALLVGIAILIFFWGLVRYLYHSADEEAAKNGRALMLWGILAIFIITTLEGIVALLKVNFFGS